MQSESSDGGSLKTSSTDKIPSQEIKKAQSSRLSYLAPNLTKLEEKYYSTRIQKYRLLLLILTPIHFLFQITIYISLFHSQPLILHFINFSLLAVILFGFKAYLSFYVTFIQIHCILLPILLFSKFGIQTYQAYTLPESGEYVKLSLYLFDLVLLALYWFHLKRTFLPFKLEVSCYLNSLKIKQYLATYRIVYREKAPNSKVEIPIPRLQDNPILNLQTRRNTLYNSTVVHIKPEEAENEIGEAEVEEREEVANEGCSNSNVHITAEHTVLDIEGEHVQTCKQKESVATCPQYQNICVLCRARKINTIARNCGHCFACRDCIQLVLQGNKLCVICRNQITKLSPLFYL